MRRAEKEITDLNDIVALLDKCCVCRLAMTDGEEPYIVPMNFGYEMINSVLILYFHCAKDGRKIDLIKKNPVVCFEMDYSHEIIQGEVACNYSMKYESLIGLGQAMFIDETQEKIKALCTIMKSASGRDDFSFEEASLNRVTTFKVVSRKYTAKRGT